MCTGWEMNKKRARLDAVFSGGEGRIRMLSPYGGPRANTKRTLSSAFSSGGEGGIRTRGRV